MSNMPSIMGKVSEETMLETGELPNDTLTEIPSPTKGPFTKSAPPRFSRRESLLTRQLNGSEGDSHNEEDDGRFSGRTLRRGLSASSNPSIASTAELTSDNDLTSPGTRTSSASPPFPATRIHSILPIISKPLSNEPIIADQEDTAEKPAPKVENNVEAGLGRKRCITFACGGNKEVTPKPIEKPVIPTEIKIQEPTEPPKRRTAITFACPGRVGIKASPDQQRLKPSRVGSPAPRSPRSPRGPYRHAHRGSDSTIKNESPQSIRKVPSFTKRRKYSEDLDEPQSEARRFHEFGNAGGVDEEWTQESTCHRSRLTIRDTLHKENHIRQLGEEAAEEALEDDDEENEDDEELLDIDEDDEIEMDDETAFEEDEEDAISDAGFDTDDEEGFAVSDAESEDSEFEWWAPGKSTAATSTDQLDHMRIAHHRTLSDSSLESSREANGLTQRPQPKMKRKTRALDIKRAVTPELPDSTDFVCGTLDEDRPLEQAYLLSKEQKKAAKHKITPQDIDPTFPTSDPELDEEDEDDDQDVKEDEEEASLFMHGNLDMNEERGRRPRADSSAANKKKSPLRLHSPPPPKKAVHRSPPPPTKKAVHRSPPPPTKKVVHRSPPPPAQAQRGQRLRSPPPRKLFGQSPKRMRSPPPNQRLNSPANSRQSSADSTPSQAIRVPLSMLGSRPQPTRTASLPRVSTATRLAHLAAGAEEDAEQGSYDIRTRGAIDIVKGLEKKRQRRKEKLYQKHCQKKIKESEKKPKPGKGAQRMREVGLELAAYRGKKAEHMLSY